ncbi:MAG: DUF4834 family protein [Bacteroidia bacterium]|nr:DUF4834 family protein [Bacteroidia bacterium]
MIFILGLLFFIIIFRLVFSMTTRFLVNKIRKAANPEDAHTDNTTTNAAKKKKISKDKGDYVDYEEIE